MPRRSKRPCSYPGCGRLTRVRFCDRHAGADDRRRGSAARRLYGRKWRRARKAYLSAHPLCRLCDDAGRTVASTVVDHIVPHRGDPELFWDQANWQALCKPCHDIKTANEDGGFGRVPLPLMDRARGGGGVKSLQPPTP